MIDLTCIYTGNAFVLSLFLGNILSMRGPPIFSVLIPRCSFSTLSFSSFFLLAARMANTAFFRECPSSDGISGSWFY